MLEEPDLHGVPGAPVVVAGLPPSPHHPVAGDDQGDGVGPHGSPYSLHWDLYSSPQCMCILSIFLNLFNFLTTKYARIF